MPKTTFILLGLLFFVTTVPVRAQDLNGTVRGLILDQQGKAVANASVTATDENTNLRRTTASSDVGVYVFPDLPVGSYTLAAEATGFAEYRRSEVLVRAAQITDVTLNLSLGAATAQVRLSLIHI